MRAGARQRFGVVAQSAADVERAKADERARGQPIFKQRARLKMRPGHGRRIVLGESVDRLEPFLALGIGLDPAGTLMRINGVEPFARPSAALGEIFA